MAETNSKARGGGEQNLTVCLRVRPMMDDEILIGASAIAHKVEDRMVVLMDPMEDPEDILRANRSREKTYVFDSAFDGSATQETVYEATTKFLIENVVTGYNATVFAYGATGAGKTYTMLGTDNDPGIMARTLNDLFQEMEKTSEDMTYKVTLSYLEIYNEMIRDLLNPSSGILDLREDSKGGIQVAGLTEIKTRSTDEVMSLLLQGNKERTQEPTAANQTSSRSHAVLQVIVRQQNRVRNVMQEVRTGKFFLIDLAGSERAANTLNRGKRMVEGAHINRSLLALGNCINALTDKNGRGYVNYRDSKLTRLLKDALGGNCKTVMIAHISPASIHFEESRNTLVYADRAKHIKTKVRRNVTDVSFHIAQYTNIIQELREEIMRLRNKLSGPVPSRGSGHMSSIQAVQSEVMESKRTADREQLNKIKEQLLISFKDQMELRKSLMELNNATMEISLETNRNQMIVSEYEVERARASKSENPDKSLENLMKDNDKAMDLAGTGTDELEEAEDVKIAREELKVLHDEKHRTEKIRMTVKKELEMARAKTRKLEELIPTRVNSEDQKEVLHLLCKVHQLEITNTEVHSNCILKNFQIKKKDMVISRFRQHQSLCDQIIQKQKNLLTVNSIGLSQELEELYDMYKLEYHLQRDDTDVSFDSNVKLDQNPLGADIDQISTLTADESEPIPPPTTSKMRKTPIDLHRSNSDDRIFTMSPKSRRFKERGLSGAWRNGSNLSEGGARQSPEIEAPRIITSPVPLAPSRTSMNDRKTIVSNTRSIAALAAKKRMNKVQNDVFNFERQMPGEPRSLYRPASDRRRDEARDDFLTPSRLDNDDKFFPDHVFPTFVSKPPSEDNLSIITKHTVISDHSLPPLRRVSEVTVPEHHRNNVRQWEPVDQVVKRKRRKNRVQESTYSQQFLKGNPRRGKTLAKTNENDMFRQDRNGRADNNKEIRDFFEGPLTPDRTKRNGQKKKNRGQTVISDSSNISTPPSHKGRKPQPTIPSYRKGDIAITGYGVQASSVYGARY